MNFRQIYRKHALLLLVSAGCTAIAVLFATYGYERTWQLWNVPTLKPYFADARVITAGAESHALGYDPLVNNPRDPWGRPMNYPRIWQLLSYLGLNQQDTTYFGVILAVLFFSGVFLAGHNIGPPTAWLMACCVFSPAVLLGLERGNTDLLIFFLLALSIRVIKKSPGVSAILVGFAFVLKLYPFFAMPIFLREDKRRAWKFLSAGILLACVYAVLMHNELRQVRLATPNVGFASYGLDGAWMQSVFGSGLPAAASLLAIAVCAGAILILALVVFRIGRRAYLDGAAQGPHMDAFRVGAAIYIGTFLIGRNFDYRLVYLLFTIPQLWLWIRGSRRWVRNVACVTLAGVLASLWSMFAARALAHVPLGGFVYLISDFFAKAAIFAGFLYLLVYSCPEWVKISCFRMEPPLKNVGAYSEDAKLGALQGSELP